MPFRSPWSHGRRNKCPGPGDVVTSIRKFRRRLWWRPELPVWGFAYLHLRDYYPAVLEVPQTREDLETLLQWVECFRLRLGFRLPPYSRVFAMSQPGSKFVWSKRAALELAFLGMATGFFWSAEDPLPREFFVAILFVIVLW
ncbi:hypothetical protein KC19_6G130500 [Ceratodon purpureus]|uniref:Uncharacterized protein n=1 Tax=Ceratodon purpureus TaxID=3225 RepID=A0A8T0HH04_CERPU|nr:hypothetical protein KC19_6G130500 [Ceratodon purpureus]